MVYPHSALPRLLSWARGMDSTCHSSGLKVRGRKRIHYRLNSQDPPSSLAQNELYSRTVGLELWFRCRARNVFHSRAPCRFVCTPAPLASLGICRLVKTSRHLMSSVASSSHRALSLRISWSCAWFVMWCCVNEVKRWVLFCSFRPSKAPTSALSRSPSSWRPAPPAATPNSYQCAGLEGRFRSLPARRRGSGGRRAASA